jgi:alpha,alpha-trehalase
VDMANIDTSNIVPVELNSYLYKYELNMVKFSSFLIENNLEVSGNINIDNDRASFETYATARKNAINTVLLDKDNCLWRDYNVTSNSWSKGTVLSSWIPLWAGLYDSDMDPQCFVDSFLNSDLLHDGGVLTTSVNSEQQWDAPNAWPPLILLLIEGLKQLSIPSALDLSV